MNNSTPRNEESATRLYPLSPSSRISLLLPSISPYPYKSPGMSYSIYNNEDIITVERKAGGPLVCRPSRVMKTYEAGEELVRLAKKGPGSSFGLFAIGKVSLEAEGNEMNGKKETSPIHHVLDAFGKRLEGGQERIQVGAAVQFGNKGSPLDYFTKNECFVDGDEMSSKYFGIEEYQKFVKDLVSSLAREPFNKFLVDFKYQKVHGNEKEEVKNGSHFILLILRNKNEYSLANDENGAQSSFLRKGDSDAGTPGTIQDFNFIEEEISLENWIDIVYNGGRFPSSITNNNSFIRKSMEYLALAKFRSVFLELSLPTDLKSLSSTLTFVNLIQSKTRMTNSVRLEPHKTRNKYEVCSPMRIDLIPASKNIQNKSIVMTKDSSLPHIQSTPDRIGKKLVSTINLMKPLFSFFKINQKKLDKAHESIVNHGESNRVSGEPEMWNEIEASLKELNKRVFSPTEKRQDRPILNQGKVLLFNSLLSSKRAAANLEKCLLTGDWPKKPQMIGSISQVHPDRKKNIKGLPSPLKISKEPATQNMSPPERREREDISSRLKQMLGYLPSLQRIRNTANITPGGEASSSNLIKERPA